MHLGISIDNEAFNAYCDIIDKNRDNGASTKDTEKHHIVPRAYYKLNQLPIDNSVDNLVVLSHFDHCLCHYYLCDCLVGTLKYKNIHAFMRMVKIHSRFELNFDEFLSLAPKFNDIYKQFVENQSQLNALSVEKRGGGTTKGRHSYTNGVINVFATVCPEGYWAGRTIKKFSDTARKNMSISAKRRSTAEYISKMKKSLTDYYANHSGSATDKIWITDGKVSKYIQKDAEIPSGWRKGRTIKRKCGIKEEE